MPGAAQFEMRDDDYDDDNDDNDDDTNDDNKNDNDYKWQRQSRRRW